MIEFLQMGGYAEFVWPSYGLVALVLWLNWYLPRREHRHLLTRLRRLRERRKNEKS